MDSVERSCGRFFLWKGRNWLAGHSGHRGIENRADRILSSIPQLRLAHQQSTREIEAIIAPALAWEQLDHAGRFLGWLTAHGVTTETGVNDDPDGDGLSNLEEYFAESDPSAFSEAEIGMQFEISSPGTHRFSLRESLDLAGRGLTAIIESSQDLNNWNAVGNLVELSSQRLNPEGVRVRILERAGSAEEVRFYRLRLILNP